ELRCPMRRLAEHNDPPVAEETSRYGAQIRHQVERQRSLPQLVADVAGRAIARFDGELGNGTNGTERYRLRIPNLRGHAQRVPRRRGGVLHHRWPFSRANERHERHQAVLFLLEGVFACAPDARQHLVRRAADGDDQAASDNELLLQRWWHHWAAGGNQDGIERGCLRPTLGAIAQNDLDVIVAEGADALPRLVHQHLVKLNGDDAL